MASRSISKRVAPGMRPLAPPSSAWPPMQHRREVLGRASSPPVAREAACSHHRLQLAQVARPRVGEEGGEHARRWRAQRRRPGGAGPRGQQVRHQRRDVGLAVAQRRQRRRHHVEPVVEVVAEAAGVAPPRPGRGCEPATTRTSAASGSRPPSRSKTPSCSTRSSFTCTRGRAAAPPRAGRGSRRGPPRIRPTPATVGLLEGALLVAEEIASSSVSRERRRS